MAEVGGEGVEEVVGLVAGEGSARCSPGAAWTSRSTATRSWRAASGTCSTVR
ncbi:hypothetical protein ACFQ0M_20610 [Kitasatospora aburaviensis]